jgi:acyl carrier protein
MLNQKDLLEKIRPAFVKVLEHEDFVLTENSTTNDIDGWSSLTHMMIISEIESDFNIKFKLIDLMRMENVGDLIVAIQNSQNL